jgi:RHS repeat-associated protein
MNKVFLFIILVVCLCFQTKAATTHAIDYINVPKVHETYILDSQLFGDSLNEYSGAVNFKRSDVSIEKVGNIEFSYEMKFNTNFPEVPGWLEDIPRIEVTYAELVYPVVGELRSYAWKEGNYCSGDQNIDQTDGTSERLPSFFDIPKSFFSSPKLIVPGDAHEFLLTNDKTDKHSSDKFITNSGWSVSCYVSKETGKEGFLAKAPNGNKYYFDIHGNIGGVQQKSRSKLNDFQLKIGSSSEAYTDDTFHQFYANKVSESLFLSKIEDQFGNWVKLEYKPGKYNSFYSSKNKYTSNQLHRIITSDLQEITIDFDGVKKTVTKNGQNWKYYFELEKFIVQLPTGKKWKYILNWASFTAPDIEGGLPACYLDYSNASNVTMNVENPTGAKGSFLFDVTRIDTANQYNSGGTTCRTGFSLQQKKITFNDKSYVWKYHYSSNEGQKSDKKIEEKHKLKGRIPDNIDRYLNKTITIKQPDLTSIKKFINRDEKSFIFGVVNAIEYFDKYSNLVRQKKVNYQKAIELGSKVRIWGNSSTETAISNIISSSVVETQTSDKYLTESTKFNSFGQPLDVRKYFVSSSTGLDNEVFYSYQYQHDFTNWNLNLLNKVYKSKTKLTDSELNTYIPISQINYSLFSDTSNSEEPTYVDQMLPSKEYSHGNLVKKNKSYDQFGNLTRIELNEKLIGSDTSLNRYQEFSNYKRGIPQTITVPKRNNKVTMTATKVVDNNGWVTSTTDFNGVTTGYKYDAIGRLLSVDLEKDSTNNIDWLDTLYEWNDTTNTRTISRCILDETKELCTENTTKFTTIETYDALLRLTHLNQNDTRYQKFEYDYNNNQTFSSFMTNAVDELKGVTTEYDALGRIDKVSTSGLGFVDYKYLAGNKIEVIDAEKNKTTTTYLAYGAPSYEQAVKIESPEDVTTDIDINIFGQVNSIKQNGYNGSDEISQTESYVYDSNQQLCLKIRSDVGVTAYSKNALGETQWIAQGVTSSDEYNATTPACITKPSTKAVTYNLDNLGDIYNIVYPDTLSDNVTYSRDNNGNITTLTAGSVEHTYSYNNQNILEDETLNIDDNSLQIDYGYNALGHKTYTAYPDNTTVMYLPNIYGEATQAKSTTNDTNLNFATAATYYANGMLEGFTYGNGIKHTTTRHDLSLLPKELKDNLDTSTNIMQLTYDYDNNANISTLTDGVDGAYSLSKFVYDGLDRLTSVTGGAKIGSSSLKYDGLGNITQYISKGSTLNYTYDYDSTDRLTKVTGVTGKYGAFNYDDSGNITHNGERGFTFNRANQLKKSGDNTYLYDGYNRRVMQKDASGTSYSMYSQGGTLLYREKNDFVGNGTNYVYLGKKLIAKYGEVESSDTSANSRQHYKPFGDTIETEKKDEIGYTGHKFDKSLGLSYMQARYYDPVIGRFYSNDPVGFSNVHNFNRYAYANNNPYKYTDPDGEAPIGINTGGGGTLFGKVSYSSMVLFDPKTLELAFVTNQEYGLGAGAGGGIFWNAVWTSDDVTIDDFSGTGTSINGSANIFAGSASLPDSHYGLDETKNVVLQGNNSSGSGAIFEAGFALGVGTEGGVTRTDSQVYKTNILADMASVVTSWFE